MKGNTMTTETKQSASLAFNDIAYGGSSDKVYHLSLEPSGGGFTVMAQYGRRGGTLATENKTKSGPVSYAAAKKIFDEVLRKKLAKRYEPFDGESPPSQVGPPLAPAGINIRPQELLLEIDERQALALVVDDAYLMQDKTDGHSRGAVKADGVIFGLNKLGKRVPLPAEVHDELARLSLRTFQIDAELVGSRLVCRDLLDADGDISGLPYEQRFVRLVELLVQSLNSDSKNISVVSTWHTPGSKAAALAEQREQRREGVVFKLRRAPHRAGRNGQHKKFKFVKTLSAVAGRPRATGKDSVEIFLLDPKSDYPMRRVGTVSLIGKVKIREFDVLEIAYLYAYPSKMLVQARLVRVRDDVETSECTTAQLQFKREEER
jgi:bifunctional non-homologous end joining protein LigD